MAKLKTDLSGDGSNIRTEREYAKSIGVKSPTVLKKAQLDEAVRRRELELSITRDKHSIYDFSFEARKLLDPQTASKARSQVAIGYFRSFPEGDGVLRRDPFTAIPETDVYVTAEIVQSCGLTDGDRVVGNFGYISQNNIRVLKSVKYVNDVSVIVSMKRTAFEDIPSVTPSEKVGMSGNNAIIGIIRNILCLGQGQSLCVSGLTMSNFSEMEKAAAELLKGLYMSFDGNVFGIFEGISENCRHTLAPVINPESMIVNGDRSEYGFLLSIMKHSVERKTPAVLVLFSVDYDASEFLRSVKATVDASLTVIAFSGTKRGAQAKIVFNGSDIVINELINTESARVCGMSRHRKIFRALSQMSDADPDSILTKFTELMNE